MAIKGDSFVTNNKKISPFGVSFLPEGVVLGLWNYACEPSSKERQNKIVSKKCFIPPIYVIFGWACELKILLGGVAGGTSEQVRTRGPPSAWAEICTSEHPGLNIIFTSNPKTIGTTKEVCTRPHSYFQISLCCKFSKIKFMKT